MNLNENWFNLVHKLLFSFAVRTWTLCPKFSNSFDIRQRSLQSAADSSSWKNLKRDALMSLLALRHDLRYNTRSIAWPLRFQTRSSLRRWRLALMASCDSQRATCFDGRRKRRRSGAPSSLLARSVRRRLLLTMPARCIARTHVTPFEFAMFNIFKTPKLYEHGLPQCTDAGDEASVIRDEDGGMLHPIELFYGYQRHLACLTVSHRIFSGTLQLHCKNRYCHKHKDFVCCLSVTRVYCDKTAEARIMKFSQQYSPMTYIFACQDWWRYSKGFPLTAVGGSNWGGVVFDRLRDAVSRKRCEMKLGWQLISNRKSYMGFQLQQKLMTLNDLERQFTALSSDLFVGWLSPCYAYCDQTVEARVMRYHYKLLLRFCYRHI